MFFPTHQEISKAVYKKTFVRQILYETRLFNYNKHLLIAQDCMKFCRGLAWQRFLVNNIADFPDVVWVKKIKILFSHWWRLQLATSPIMTHSGASSTNLSSICCLPPPHDRRALTNILVICQLGNSMRDGFFLILKSSNDFKDTIVTITCLVSNQIAHYYLSYEGSYSDF